MTKIAGKPVAMVFPLKLHGDPNPLPVDNCLDAMRGYGRCHTTRTFEPYKAYGFSEGDVALAYSDNRKVAFRVGKQYRITRQMIDSPEYQQNWANREKHNAKELLNFKHKPVVWGLEMEPLGDYINGEIVPFPNHHSKTLNSPTPESIDPNQLAPHQIPVWGANTEGRHGKGLAKAMFGNHPHSPGIVGDRAIYGKGEGYHEGRKGGSYAIITKDLAQGQRSIPLNQIGEQIDRFLEFAQKNPSREFLVTPIGTGLAGYSPQEIGGLFQKKNLPNNVRLPAEFQQEQTQKTTPRPKIADSIQLLTRLESDITDPLLKRLETLKPKLRSDVSNYAKGRLNVWLGVEWDLKNKDFKSAGFFDPQLWDFCDRIYPGAQIALITYSGDEQGTGINLHRDDSYAAFEARSVSLESIPGQNTQWEMRQVYPGMNYTRERTENAKTTQFQIPSGSVTAFNCKNPHAAYPSKGRWSINIWKIAPKYLEKYQKFITQLGISGGAPPHNPQSADLILPPPIKLRERTSYHCPPLQETKTTNPLAHLQPLNAKVAGPMQKDLAMGAIATQFIGRSAAPPDTPSSTRNYEQAWGERANTGNYSPTDIVMVSGSGPWRGVTQTQIQATFQQHYVPLLEQATRQGATIIVGNAKGTDQLVQQYLTERGYNLSAHPNSKGLPTPFVQCQPSPIREKATTKSQFYDRVTEKYAPVVAALLNYEKTNDYQGNIYRATWFNSKLKLFDKGSSQPKLAARFDNQTQKYVAIPLQQSTTRLTTDDVEKLEKLAIALQKRVIQAGMRVEERE